MLEGMLAECRGERVHSISITCRPWHAAQQRIPNLSKLSLTASRPWYQPVSALSMHLPAGKEEVSALDAAFGEDEAQVQARRERMTGTHCVESSPASEISWQVVEARYFLSR